MQQFTFYKYRWNVTIVTITFIVTIKVQPFMVLTTTQTIQDNNVAYITTLGDHMNDLERRVELLEAQMMKLARKPVTRTVKQLDHSAARIRSALLNVENHIFSRDLLRTEDIIGVIYADILSGCDSYGIDSATLSVTVPARLKLIPELISVVMTGYTDRGTKRFNQSVWVIRNHEKYKNMSVTQLYHEYKAQRDRADIESSSQPHLVIK